jgi:hypothetical protein
MRVRRQQQQQQNRKKNTAKNIRKYAPDQVEKTQAFVTSGGVVRGHGSRNSNYGRQGNTDKDVNALRNFQQ